MSDKDETNRTGAGIDAHGDVSIGGDAVGRDKITNIYINPAGDNLSGATAHDVLLIDDVLVAKQRKCVKLDVRVRNPGKSAINVTRVNLHVLERSPYTAVYQPSASYDLLLDGENNEIPVAHILRPNEVDRFVIRVGFTPFNTSCGFTAELVLTFNGGPQATSKPFTFASVFS